MERKYKVPLAAANGTLYFRSIHGTMSHILGGDQIWHARLTNTNTTNTNTTTATANTELMATITPIYALEPPEAIGLAWEARSPDRATLFQDLLSICDAWCTLLQEKNDAWCMLPITYTDTAGVPTTLIRAAGLSQVFNHGTHHRAQISAAFSHFNLAMQCPSFDLQSMKQRFKEYRPELHTDEQEQLTADERLHSLLAYDFQYQHSDNPEFASQSGNHQYSDKLQHLSPASFEQRRIHNSSVLARLEAIKEQDLTSDVLRVRRTLFYENVSQESAAFDLGCHLYSLNSIGCKLNNIHV